MELGKKRPEVVSLVALGTSKINFFSEAMLTGSRRGLADEVWVINKMGVIVKHDMLFRMDDLRTTYSCNAKSFTGGNTPKEGIGVHDTYDEFLKNHDKPIMTSTAYPEYPTSVPYPLEEIINLIGYPYFRTTPAYAVAYAIYLGVKQLRLYGCDYNYPTERFKAESGKANMEFILSIGMQRGLDVFIAPTSSLMDTCLPPEEIMYGYANPMDVVKNKETGKLEVTMQPELGKKIRDKKRLAERADLQALMTKYQSEVKHDLIEGGWITRDDFDQHELNKQEEQKLLDAPDRDSKGRFIKKESQKGECTCQVQKDSKTA